MTAGALLCIAFTHATSPRVNHQCHLFHHECARVRAAWAEQERVWMVGARTEGPPTENEAGLARPHQREMCARTA